MSYGQRILTEILEHLFSGVKARQNARPWWLEGLEIDIFYPEMRIGFEFQGDQHYVDIYGNLSDQKARDARKKEICRQRGIKLFLIDAIDLDCKRLFLKLRPHLKWLDASFQKEDPMVAKLDHKARLYRANISKTAASPSSHERNSPARRSALRGKVVPSLSSPKIGTLPDPKPVTLEPFQPPIVKQNNKKVWAEKRKARKERLRILNEPGRRTVGRSKANSPIPNT